MIDLFSYPRSPGFKEKTTSRDAARAVTPGALALREKVFAEIARTGERGLTADQVATILDRSVLSVRPRVTELFKAQRIIPTGERRANDSSLKAKVWRAS